MCSEYVHCLRAAGDCQPCSPKPAVVVDLGSAKHGAPSAGGKRLLSGLQHLAAWARKAANVRPDSFPKALVFVIKNNNNDETTHNKTQTKNQCANISKLQKLHMRREKLSEAGF